MFLSPGFGCSNHPVRFLSMDSNPTFLPAASVIIDHGNFTYLLPGNNTFAHTAAIKKCAYLGEQTLNRFSIPSLTAYLTLVPSAAGNQQVHTWNYY